ncbi:LOW QUALITY PROTEIN: relaxin receptor 2 [Chlamydotis macqueenii]
MPKGTPQVDSSGDNSEWASIFDMVHGKPNHLDLSEFLQHNCIQTISRKAFFRLCKLQKLYLSYKCITGLKPGVLRDLHKLKWLMLDYNPIVKISQQLFTVIKSLSFGKSMINNSLETPAKKICAQMPLINMDFEGNHIKALTNPTFLQCNELTVLCGNGIHLVPANTFSSLKDLGELWLQLALIITGVSPPVWITDHNIYIVYRYLEMIEILNINRRLFQHRRNISHMYAYKIKEEIINGSMNCAIYLILEKTSKVDLINHVPKESVDFIDCKDSQSTTGSDLQPCKWLKSVCADFLMGVYLFFIGVFDVKCYGQDKKYAVLWMESLLCHIMGFTASTEALVLLLTYLTLEIVIVFPFSNIHPGKQQTVVNHQSIWVARFVIAIIPFEEDFFGNYYGKKFVFFPLNSEQREEIGGNRYSLGIFLGVNLLTSIIIMFSVSMFCSVQKNALQILEVRSHTHRDAAVANRFFLIVFTDAICWIPVLVIEILSLFQVEIPGAVPSWTVSSALNPILYTLTTSFFKEKLKQSLDSHRRREIFTMMKNLWPL